MRLCSCGNPATTTKLTAKGVKLPRCALCKSGKRASFIQKSESGKARHFGKERR